jgi:hypothetical protein
MKRLSNLAESHMPPAPGVEEFVVALRKVFSPSDNTDPLLGELPVTTVAVKEQHRSRKAALKTFLQYIAVCEVHGVKHASLDDCFVAWGRWSIHAQELYPTPEQADICVAARKEKAGADVPLRSMPVLTFRTYINSVAFLYKMSQRSFQPIVPSSVAQFPNFNAFFNPLLTKALAAKVPGWSGDPSNTAITEEELVTVVGTVNEKRPLEVQRRCLDAGK